MNFGINDFLLDLVFPKVCAACKREENYLCKKCFGELVPRISLQGDGEIQILSLYTYKEGEPLAKLLHLWKYQFVRDARKVLKEAIKQCMQENVRNFFSSSVLCPVPLHQKRLKWRGFHQTKHLCETLDGLLGNNVRIEFLLEKTIHTKPQAELGKAERMKNLSGVFRAASGIAGAKKIILVDDVATTGSTLRECAKVLRGAYPGVDVAGFVVARTL